MPTEAPAIVRAILNRDVESLSQNLAQGESPDQIWGTLPLLAHAALIPDSSLFQMLIEYGATVPEDFLHQVITWELGDWRINSNADEEELAKILRMIRSTKAWLSLEQRRQLASELQGYNLPRIVAALTEEG